MKFIYFSSIRHWLVLRVTKWSVRKPTENVNLDNIPVEKQWITISLSHAVTSSVEIPLLYVRCG